MKPESLLHNEALTEEIIANHFIIGIITPAYIFYLCIIDHFLRQNIGEEIRPETLIKGASRFTAGGQPLHFKIDKNGQTSIRFAREMRV